MAGITYSLQWATHHFITAIESNYIYRPNARKPWLWADIDNPTSCTLHIPAID